MPFELDDARLALLVDAADAQAGLLHAGPVLGAQAIAAEVILHGRLGSVEAGGPGPGEERDAMFLAP
jgi:hypothetical protein